VDRPGEPVVRRRCADGEYAGVLRDLGLDLPTGEVEALVATLPPDDGEAER
jgi:hypothetical protein